MRRHANTCSTNTANKIPGTKQTSHPGKNEPRMSMDGAREQPATLQAATRTAEVRGKNCLTLVAIILRAP